MADAVHAVRLRTSRRQRRLVQGRDEDWAAKVPLKSVSRATIIRRQEERASGMTPDDDQVTVGFAVPAHLSGLSARYEIHAEIGRGGMGAVYKALDRQTGDLVAIKVLHP